MAVCLEFDEVPRWIGNHHFSLLDRFARIRCVRRLDNGRRILEPRSRSFPIRPGYGCAEMPCARHRVGDAGWIILKGKLGAEDENVDKRSRASSDGRSKLLDIEGDGFVKGTNRQRKMEYR